MDEYSFQVFLDTGGYLGMNLEPNLPSLLYNV
jgi:hypothetical protein